MSDYGAAPAEVRENDYIWDHIDRELRKVTEADTERAALPYALADGDCELWLVPKEVAGSPEEVAEYINEWQGYDVDPAEVEL